ncbi:MAG: helix-turn-helix transcriptional regulator [Phycisphaeraceae bacterium]
MQTVKTKKKKRVKRGPKVESRRAVRFVVEGSRTTHALVPIDEYERLLMAEMATEAERVLDDPNTEWVDVDDLFAEFAAERVTAARKAQGVTQQELANRLGMAQTQISRIERNPDRTTVRTLKRIAKALGVDVRKLIG